MIKLGAMFTVIYLVLASTCIATKILSFQVPTLSCSRHRHDMHNGMRTVPMCQKSRAFQLAGTRETFSISDAKTNPSETDAEPSGSTDTTEISPEYGISLRGGSSDGSTSGELTKSNPLSPFSFKSLALYSLLLVEFGLRITDNVNMAISTQLLSANFWSSLAPFASIALKMSPLPTILTVRKNKSVGGLPLLPYNAMATMTFVLVAYGVTKGDAKIICAHGVGHLLSLFYCVSYLKHSPKTATNLPGTAEQHKLVSFSIISFVLAAMAFLEPTAASKVVGWTSVVLSMIMYVGPLTRLRSSIAAKSARDIPLPFAIVGLVNAVAWFVYGFIVKNDVVLYAPCLIGLMSTSGQILVNLLYGKKQKLA